MQYRSRLKRALIGDRAFYRMVFTILVPIVIQNSVSNFVNLLDNLMVGALGTEAVSGVAVSNQLLFVFNLCIFGGLAGPGIFGAQYFGAKDMEGVRNAFRIKLWLAALLILLFLGVFLGAEDALILTFLKGEGEAASADAILQNAKEYLGIMAAGLLPFALTQCYSGTLREAHETALPMKAGITAVLTNLIGNWLLINGHLGFPALGIKGAAIATVLSRFVELSIILVAVRRSGRYAFMHGAWHTLKVPAPLARSVLKKGTPLLVNEFFWSLGVAKLVQIYSLRGLNVLAGLNIASTFTNLFNVVFLSMGSAVAVIIGQALGANDMHRAKSEVWKLMAFSVFSCLVTGGVLAALSPFFPHLYNTGADVKALATCFMLTSACVMPINAIAHCSYFTLRSGGSTIITFFFDSVYSWAVQIPFALLMVHATNLPIMALYPICQAVEVVKSTIGILLVKKGVWIRNIVSGPADEAHMAGQEG